MAGDMPSAYVQAKIPDGKRYYMRQPEGFVNPQHPKHVLQLQKALYGLPIAGHEWADLFSSSLVELGFANQWRTHVSTIWTAMVSICSWQ